MSFDVFAPAHRIAAQVREGQVTALAVTEAVLARIAAFDSAINAFTDVTAERALAQARAVDAARAAGAPLGPLAGVPFAAKNLFDIAGLPTRAGLEDQSRAEACRARRGAGRAADGGGRRAACGAQHGRIRL